MGRKLSEIYIGSYVIHDTNVQIYRGNVKNYNLRVRPNGSVRLCIPLHTGLQDAQQLLCAHSAWIDKKRQKILAETLPAASKEELISEKALLKQQIPPLLESYGDSIGVRCTGWRLRTMLSRWGSCNIHTARITFNTELGHLPICCLESVVVHELCHLRVSAHNSEFYALMDRYYPNWKQARKILNDNPPRRATELL